MTDQKLITALVRTAFSDGYQTALERDASLEDLNSAWDRSASSDDLVAYLTAQPQPSGPVVERMAAAIKEMAPISDGRMAARNALTVILAEIEAERAGPSPLQVALDVVRCKTLDRLTARLTGGQKDG